MRIPWVSKGALSVLSSVLYPYQKLVKSSTPPSARRSVLLATIEKLRTRITTLSSHGAEGTRLVLTDEEVSIIDHVLTFFIQSMKSMVPASQQRDETLEACRHLQFGTTTHAEESSSVEARGKLAMQLYRETAHVLWPTLDEQRRSVVEQVLSLIEQAG